MTIKLNKIHNCSAREGFKRLPENCVDTIITSPPYWALRVYETNPVVWDDNQNCKHEWGKPQEQKTELQAGKPEFQRPWREEASRVSKSNFCQKCGAWRGELGLEQDFDLYIKHLCDIFELAKKPLKPEGTLWVVIGDTYYTKSGSGFTNDTISPDNTGKGIEEANKLRGRPHEYMQEKSLVGIPFRFALEMINRGWILRNTIIWHKPNCMPSSAKDRFTVDFEYVFFFSQEKQYYFERQFEPYSENTDLSEAQRGYFGKAQKDYESAMAQNPSDAKRRMLESYKTQPGRNKRSVWEITTKSFRAAHFAVFPEELIEPMVKAGCPKGGVVLDPFMGSGTTARVAKRLGRNYLGFELNPKFAKMARVRAKGGDATAIKIALDVNQNSLEGFENGDQ